MKPKIKNNRVDLYSNEYLSPNIDSLVEQLHECRLSPCEFVGAYIILFIKNQYPQRWFVGPLSEPLKEETVTYFEIELPKQNRYVSIFQIGGLEFTTKEQKRILKEMPEDLTPTIPFLFSHFMFLGIPSFVNNAILQWSCNKRSARLLFQIPTSEEVLNMQIRGERCITVFVEKSELNRELKDSYPPFETRNVLNFTIHDLQHLEKFYDRKFYCEQVGVLEHMKRLIEHAQIKAFFSNYDNEFWKDVEHVIADMNACSIHLLAFFKAKWKMADSRTKFPLSTEFDSRYDQLLATLAVPDFVREATKTMCSDKFSPADGSIIRQYFHERGKNLLELDFEFQQ